MAASDVNAAVELAAGYMAAGNWSAAKTQLMVAKAHLIALPDQRKGSAELRYDRAAVDSLMAEVKQEIAAALGSGGIQRIKYRHVRPGCE